MKDTMLEALIEYRQEEIQSRLEEQRGGCFLPLSNAGALVLVFDELEAKDGQEIDARGLSTDAIAKGLMSGDYLIPEGWQVALIKRIPPGAVH